MENKILPDLTDLSILFNLNLSGNCPEIALYYYVVSYA